MRMMLHWLAVLACVSVLAAGHPLSDTTQDTLVVAKSDDTSTEPAVTTTEQTEVTTDGPVLPIKLTEMEVTSVVSLRYAHTSVVAHVKNPGNRAQEADFRVLLPKTAFISGFVMTLDGKSYKAYVKEKEEAKQIYDQAVSHGVGAAHIQAKARDSNQFVVSVNVEPSSSAVFNLTYEELLTRRNGVYNHAINLHPGALVPKLSVTVIIKETHKITTLRVPEVRTGNEIDATIDDAQNTKAVIVKGDDDKQVTISFTPDLDEQQRLMDIYAEKSKDSSRSHWRRTDVDNDQRNGVLGQFIVQYDVERPKDGEILVNDGYFVHFFAPSDLPPLHKYVVFVLDTSSSMMGRKIEQLREAMQIILSDLKPGDFFSIVDFSSTVWVHELNEADQEESHSKYSYYKPERTLVQPSPATAENIAKAKVIVSKLYASGGTNIDAALDAAINLIHKRADWAKTPNNNASTTTVAPTDDANLNDIESLQTLEPIIIFLTDGVPYSGETNPTTLVNKVTEKNSGENKASIFTLSFGNDADRKFLRKLSLRNDGFMRHIYEAADAALQLRDFYRRVSSPLLADVKFIYPTAQVEETSVTQNKFKTYYAGSEVVVAGKLADEAPEVTAQVLAFCGVQNRIGRIRFEKTPKAPVPATRQEYLPLERLWSYLTIKQLLDERDASDSNEKKENAEKKALALALKYEFVTPLTSLVVVKPNATDAVNAESVDKPGNSGSSFFANVAAAGQTIRDSSLISSNVAYRKAYRPLSFSHSHSYPSSHHYPTFAYMSSGLSGAGGSGYSALSNYPSSLGFGGSGGGYTKISNSLNIADSSSHSFTILSGRHQPSYADIFRVAAHSANPISNYAQTLPSPATQTPPPVPVSTTVPPHPLEPYHLQEYSWAEGLLNVTADALVLNHNGADIIFKLTKDINAPKSAAGDASCADAVGGGAGHCVYLTRCVSAKTITVDLYRTAHCTFDGFAGVCCNEKDIDKADSNPSA